MKRFNKMFVRLVLFLSSLHFALGIHNAALVDGQTFDYIIVGGGLGGCVVAARLAENGENSVLVIHEGAIANENLNIPALSSNFRGYPHELKYYSSVPQRHVRQANDGVVRFVIGKSIGGGSSVNGQIWNRGNPQDYNNWAQLLNDSSWNYDNMLPVFKKIENYHGHNPTDQRGYNGPISIENRLEQDFGTREVLEAIQELGYPLRDANGPQTPSASIIDYSRSRGRRVSAFSGYIGPLLAQAQSNSGARIPGRPGKLTENLVVLLNTEAKRLIFQGNRVVGVTFVNLNTSQNGFVNARKEVILSAGTMDSPLMLMRSGIGPQAILAAARIPAVKYAEGVGRNLRDHVLLRQPIIFGNRNVAFIASRDLTPEAWEEYQRFGTGPYTVYGGGDAQGFFLSSLQAQIQSRWPDLQMVSLHIEIPLAGLNETEVAVSWGLMSVRNKSKGTIAIDTRNIDNPPVLDFNYLENPDDMRQMIDVLKLAEDMCETTAAMQGIGCRFPPPLTACNAFEYRTDAYYQCHISQHSDTALHVGGTCKMGRVEDPEAVVDSDLRVIGIQNLRIADASVMPTVTNANTQAPVYAIAERAAELILGYSSENRRN